jgi:GT2 family glycosyltransferase
MVDSTTTNRAVVPARVSIIIVNYNCMKDIDVCISSVLAQTYPDYEVVFADNNSTDGSFEYAMKAFPGLTFVKNTANLGYAGGIRSALPYCLGEYVAPLNIDTEVTPEWLGTMVEFMDSHPRVGAVTPRIMLFDKRDTVNAMGHNIHVSGLSFCRNLYRRYDGATAPRKVTGVSGCSYLIRRDVLNRMGGGAPTECFMANDDVIVSWLLTMMGFDIYCLPESVVYHKYRLKMDPEKMFRLEYWRLRLLMTGLKRSTLIVGLPVFGVVELMTIGFAIMKGSPFVKAKIRAYRATRADSAARRQDRRQWRQLAVISDFALLRRLCWNLEWSQAFRMEG